MPTGREPLFPRPKEVLADLRPGNQGKGGREKIQGKGEGPRKNWEKVQVLWICRGVGVFPSRVIRDEYRI